MHDACVSVCCMQNVMAADAMTQYTFVYVGTRMQNAVCENAKRKGKESGTLQRHRDGSRLASTESKSAIKPLYMQVVLEQSHIKVENINFCN